jgi:hypothetical protein
MVGSKTRMRMDVVGELGLVPAGAACDADVQPPVQFRVLTQILIGLSSMAIHNWLRESTCRGPAAEGDDVAVGILEVEVVVAAVLGRHRT